MLRWWDHWLKGKPTRRHGRADAARLDDRQPSAGVASRDVAGTLGGRARLAAVVTASRIACSWPTQGWRRRARRLHRATCARRKRWAARAANGVRSDAAAIRRAISVADDSRSLLFETPPLDRDHRDPGRAGRHARPCLRQACRQPGGPAVRRPSVGRIAARELRRAEPHASRQPCRAIAAGAGRALSRAPAAQRLRRDAFRPATASGSRSRPPIGRWSGPRRTMPP